MPKAAGNFAKNIVAEQDVAACKGRLGDYCCNSLAQNLASGALKIEGFAGLQVLQVVDELFELRATLGGEIGKLNIDLGIALGIAHQPEGPHTGAAADMQLIAQAQLAEGQECAVAQLAEQVAGHA